MSRQASSHNPAKNNRMILETMAQVYNARSYAKLIASLGV